MATKHVIAYAMHEAELGEAARMVENAQVTESYVIGDIDEDRIEELERAGLVVDEVAPAGRPTTAAMARGTLSAETGVDGWRAGDEDEIPPPEPGTPTQWLVSLNSPLMGEMREALGGDRRPARRIRPPSRLRRHRDAGAGVGGDQPAVRP